MTPNLPSVGGGKKGGSAGPDEGRPYGGSPLMGKPPGRGRVCPARNFTAATCLWVVPENAPLISRLRAAASPLRGEAKVIFIIEKG